MLCTCYAEYILGTGPQLHTKIPDTVPYPTLPTGTGLQVVGLAALLVRLSVWLGLLSHRRRLSGDGDAPPALPVQVLYLQVSLP